MLVDTILKELDVYGYEMIEKPLLASLVTQEPILFIGSHGTGKTLLSYTLAKALGYSVDGEDKEFHTYDASKSLFEDIVGFPDPEKMKNGRVDYLHSPITLWNKKFILIDEISRANPSMQNKWLEIIRSRCVMGKEISSLEYIFAAMNPVDYPGANSLDPALADRFSLIVNIPETFNTSSISSIISSIHKDDSPGLRKVQKINKEKKYKKKLFKLINDIRNIYNNLPENLLVLSDNFSKIYYQNAAMISKIPFLTVSPRRAAMMYRNLNTFFAIDIYEKGELSKDDIFQNITDIAKYSWIFSTFDEEYSDYKEEVLYKTLSDIKMININEFERIRTEHIINDFNDSMTDDAKLIGTLYILNKLSKLQKNPQKALEQDISIFKIINKINEFRSDSIENFPSLIKGLNIKWVRVLHNFNYLDNLDIKKLKKLIKGINKKGENYEIKNF